MSFISRLFAVIAVVMVAVSCGSTREAPGAADRSLDAAITDIETGRVTTPLVGQPGHRLRVAILAGRSDQANLATAQNARQALADAGHDVDYIEVPEGHNPTAWRNHLSDVLVSLFGNFDSAPGTGFQQ